MGESERVPARPLLQRTARLANVLQGAEVGTWVRGRLRRKGCRLGSRSGLAPEMLVRKRRGHHAVMESRLPSTRDRMWPLAPRRSRERLFNSRFWATSKSPDLLTGIVGHENPDEPAPVEPDARSRAPRCWPARRAGQSHADSIGGLGRYSIVSPGWRSTCSCHTTIDLICKSPCT